MRVLIFALSILAGVTAYAGSLSLDAHEIGTKDSFQSYWENWAGSYDRDYARGKRILVTVRDFSRKIPQCDITVYFVAHPVFNSEQRFIYDKKEFPVRFRGRIEVAGPVTASDLHARIVNLAGFARYGRGAEMDGWIVIGELRGQVFDVKASGPTLLDIAKSPALRELERDYYEAVETGRH
jgi:hypothetical protein